MYPCDNRLLYVFCILSGEEVGSIPTTEMLVNDQLDDAKTSNLSPGKLYLMKKKMGQIIDAKVEQEQEKFIAPLHEELAALSSSVFVEKRWKESGHEDESMVFNCAYLVPLSNVQSFADKISAFKKHIKGNEWKIAMSGPWPPYHFAKANRGA